MNIKKIKDTAKSVAWPVWVAGLIIPGGLTVLAAYLAYKASRKKTKTLEQTLEEARKEVENDRG